MHAHSDALAPTAALEGIVGPVTISENLLSWIHPRHTKIRYSYWHTASQRALQQNTQLHGADIIDKHILPYSFNKFDNYCGDGFFVNKTTAVP